MMEVAKKSANFLCGRTSLWQDNKYSHLIETSHDAKQAVEEPSRTFTGEG